MLNIMSGIVHPTRGRILFDGVDVTATNTSNRNNDENVNNSKNEEDKIINVDKIFSSALTKLTLKKDKLQNLDKIDTKLIGIE